MARFRRREKPPPIAGLERDERVVAWADTRTGDVVAATTLGLWWDGRRIAWQHIDKVVWSDGVLSVTEAQVVDDELLVDLQPVHVPIVTPRNLPPVVRKRIENTIAKTELLTVPGGAVRFVARRRPGHDGLTWWARLEPGTPASETVRAAIRARLALLREAANDRR